MSSSRIVQLSDTHISALAPVPETLRALLDWIAADPPDLVVVSGDIVREDPDDAADRAHAHRVLSAVPCRLVVIPGNHDVGFFDERDRFADRHAAFAETWGADRFSLDLPGWRLVGLDVYALGEAGHDDWAVSALADDRAVGVLVHQPVDGDPDDGWQMPPGPRERLSELLAGSARLAFVASGHRHCGAVDDRPLNGARRDVARIWAPSTTFVGAEPYLGGNPEPGAVDYLLHDDGTFAWRFVSPLGVTVGAWHQP